MSGVLDIHFEHEKEEYTVASFYEKYQHNLPQIIVVTQGYCGDIGLETFGIGQVIRIHTYSSQRRVVARIQKGIPYLDERDLSIPVNYDVKFFIKGHKKSAKEMSLEEILENHSLPVNVIPSAVGKFQFGDKVRAVGEQCELQLTKTYDDRYLLGNGVMDGMLYAQMTAVPVYLPDIKLSVAKGIKSYNEEQWQACKQNMAELVSANVKFQSDFGNPHVALYSEAKPAKSDNDYEYTYRVPVEYYNMEDILQHKLNRFSKPIYSQLNDQTYAFIPADYETETVQKRASKSLPPPAVLPKPVLHDKPLTVSLPAKQNAPVGSPPPPLPKRISMQNEYTEINSPQQKQATDTDRNASAIPSSVAQPSSRNVNVSKLSIDGLAEWMKKLKLEKYISAFREQMMDGTLLLECEKNDLINDFKMKAVEANRLLKFSKTGHVPH